MTYRKGSVSIRKSSNEKKFDEKLFIGTLGVNCLEYTRRMIDSVSVNCSEVKLVYIDNGSSSENQSILKTWKKMNPDIHSFSLGFNGHNAGVSFGWNQLIKIALKWEATKILICNNDIVFGRHTIPGMIDGYDRLRKEDDRTVMVTATNQTKNPNELDSIQPKWAYHEHPDFSCFMITPESIKRIGFFNTDYDPAFFEDNDMHWRILLSGYKAFGTDFAPYSHIASRTRHGNPNLVTHQRFRENKIKFFRNMLTNTVDQTVADQRYAAWLADNGQEKHPHHEQVQEHARKVGLIDAKLERWLADLTFLNVPM